MSLEDESFSVSILIAPLILYITFLQLIKIDLIFMVTGLFPLLSPLALCFYSCTTPHSLAMKTTSPFCCQMR